MNLPNKLTVLRLLLATIGVVLYSIFKTEPWVIITLTGIFIVASITDFLDGRIARKHNLVTGFGKLMDPLADKVLVISMVLILIDSKKVPYLYMWAALIIIVRELFVLGVRLAALEGNGNVIAAGIMGKLKTTAQMVSISAILILLSIASLVEHSILTYSIYAFVILFYVSTILCVLSGIEYFWKNKEYFKMK